MQLGVVVQVVLNSCVGAVDSRNMRREVGWALPSLRRIILVSDGDPQKRAVGTCAKDES